VKKYVPKVMQISEIKVIFRFFYYFSRSLDADATKGHFLSGLVAVRLQTCQPDKNEIQIAFQENMFQYILKIQKQYITFGAWKSTKQKNDLYKPGELWLHNGASIEQWRRYMHC